MSPVWAWPSSSPCCPDPEPVSEYMDDWCTRFTLIHWQFKWLTRRSRNTLPVVWINGLLIVWDKWTGPLHLSLKLGGGGGVGGEKFSLGLWFFYSFVFLIIDFFIYWGVGGGAATAGRREWAWGLCEEKYLHWLICSASLCFYDWINLFICGMWRTLPSF